MPSAGRIAGTIMATLGAWSVSGWAVGAQEAAAFDHVGLATQALEKHIRPGYAALVSAAEALTKALDGYCARRIPEQQRGMERAFDGLVTAWGRIEHIRFGPVTEANRLERIFFWPDRRGLGARQIVQTLRARDLDALDPTKLAEKRVAIQGLAALEIALFDTPPKEPEARDYRCAYAKAISANIANVSVAVLAEWTVPDRYVRHWLNPGAGNPYFLKPSETTLALAKALDNGLERVRDEWIAGPLGFGPQRRRLTPVLSKSARTLKYIQAGLDGLYDLYATAGMHKAIADTSGAHPGVTVPLNAKLVEREIATARNQIRRLVRQGKPFDPDAMMQPLVAIGFPLKNAREQAVALLGLTAGVSIGFNASDGD
ncbi:MAG: imelysin family protein [Hyphomicrobiaceae bacterium]